MIWALLIAQGLTFLVWAGLMFFALVRLAAWARAQPGRALPGPGRHRSAWGAFRRAPGFRTDRRVLAAVTLALFALIALNLWTLSSRSPVMP